MRAGKAKVGMSVTHHTGMTGIITDLVRSETRRKTLYIVIKTDQGTEAAWHPDWWTPARKKKKGLSDGK